MNWKGANSQVLNFVQILQIIQCENIPSGQGKGDWIELWFGPRNPINVKTAWKQIVFVLAQALELSRPKQTCYSGVWRECWNSCTDSLGARRFPLKCIWVTLTEMYTGVERTPKVSFCHSLRRRKKMEGWRGVCSSWRQKRTLPLGLPALWFQCVWGGLNSWGPRRRKGGANTQIN